MCSGNELQAQNKSIESTTWDISITWNHPSRNADLVTRYEVYLQEKTGHSWKSPERIYAGSNTEFTSPCSLQSGRLYQFFIRSQIVLSNPAQAISVDSSYINTVLGYTKVLFIQPFYISLIQTKIKITVATWILTLFKSKLEFCRCRWLMFTWTRQTYTYILMFILMFDFLQNEFPLSAV